MAQELAARATGVAMGSSQRPCAPAGRWRERQQDLALTSLTASSVSRTRRGRLRSAASRSQQRACLRARSADQSATRCAVLRAVRLVARKGADPQAAAFQRLDGRFCIGPGNAPYTIWPARPPGWLSVMMALPMPQRKSSPANSTGADRHVRSPRHRADQAQRAAVPATRAASNSRMICIACTLARR